MKKTLSAIMAFVIALSCMMGLGMTTLAADDPTYSVRFSRQEAQQLDVVTMDIDIKNNPGLISLRFQVVYDETVLKLVSVEDTQLLKGWTTPAPTIKSPYILRWADSLSTVNHTENGTVARLTFKVRDGAAFDKTKVTIEHIESRQTDGTKVYFANASAEFKVVCPHLATREEITKQPTHTETGTKAIICTACGETVRTETIPALGHTFGEWVVTQEPTCTEKGVEERTCSCGVKETREVAAKGHTFGDWVVTTAPTCTEKGVEERTCSCGIKEIREIAAKGHTPGEWVVTTEPTCTEKGVETQKCSVCGADIASRDVAAKGHTAGEWEIVREATCTEAGEKKAVCTDCGEEFTEAIPAKGHIAGEWEIVKDATCTEAGEKKAVCTACDKEFTEEIPALGHTFGEWKVVKEPTETEEGLKERVCSVCGEKETEVIPKLTVDVTNPDDTKTPDIPKTGAVVAGSAIAAFAMLATAGAAATVTYKKRKK